MGQAPYLPGTMTPNGSDGPSWKIPSLLGGLSGALKGCVARFSSSAVPPEDVGEFLTGSVHYFPGDVVPTGFLVCNGAYLLRSEYAALFAAIGVVYGTSGPTDFRLPDYGGYFLRFSDFGSGADPDYSSRTNRGDGAIGAAIGTVQQGALLAHRHIVGYSTVFGSVAVPCEGSTASSNASDGTLTGIGVENRPKNINIMAVIKI